MKRYNRYQVVIFGWGFGEDELSEYHLLSDAMKRARKEYKSPDVDAVFIYDYTRNAARLVCGYTSCKVFSDNVVNF